MNQLELEANTCCPFFNQLQSVAMQNQSTCGINFNTQLKSALLLWLTIHNS